MTNYFLANGTCHCEDVFPNEDLIDETIAELKKFDFKVIIYPDPSAYPLNG